MGSIDSAFGGSIDGGFEPDDFYESFLAPKFHDFTAPEEPIDPDAYFLSKPGMLKKAFAKEDVKTAAPKIHKVTAQEIPKAAAVVPVASHQQQQQVAPSKSPVAAEKTVRVGSAKKSSVVAPVASPLANKSLKNGTVNSPSHQQQLPMMEKSLKPMSLAKKLQASENDDPNSPADAVHAKAVKPVLPQQRSQKVHEENPKPALTRQRSQKVSEPKHQHGDSSDSDKERPRSKTPVKDAAVSCPGSPYNGHHCKHARCAANDPNMGSPVPTKKYLVAKKGTPGSIRKPVESGSDGESSADVVAVPKSQVALVEAFNQMALEPEKVPEKTSLTSENIRDWSRNSVHCDEKAVVCEENTAATTANVESKVDVFLQVASDCLEKIDLNKLDVPPTKVVGKKRKSGEMLPAGASKKANCAAGENKAVSKKTEATKEAAAAAASKTAKMKLRRLSVARRLSVVRSRPGVTNPRPFRLRTQERGAVKEQEFRKKVEEYKAAKEGFQSAFQGLAAVEPKIPGKFLKSGHVFSAKRADQKDEKEVTKPSIPVAQKAPHFDHPFKPHRSTKKLTVPQEPKFHNTARSRNVSSLAVAVPSA